MADVVIINKIDTAGAEAVQRLRENIRSANERALVIEAASPVSADGADRLRGRRVLVIEDGPTVTHGDMTFGAGTTIARKYGAGTIVDPRPYAVGSLAETYRTYPRIGALLPAMGYSAAQVADLAATIAQVPCDVVVIGTPIDLTRLMQIDKPTLRVRYELQEIGRPDLGDVLRPFIDNVRAARRCKEPRNGEVRSG
jgi:predicted GTPase